MKNLTKVLITGLMVIGLAACGSGSNNNSQADTALSGAGINGTTGGCFPSVVNNTSAVLNFAGTNVSLSSTQILAGILPNGDSRPGTYGTMAMGSTGSGGSIQFQTKQSSAGQIQFSITPSGTTSNITGSIQLSPSVINYITQITNQSQSPLTVGNYPSICNISLNVVEEIQSTYGYINQAEVYVTTSNGQVFGPLTF